jgi:membrane protease YdiL (CAAX protease family)
MENKIPVRFFIVAFLWTWFFWIIPLVFTETGIFSVNNDYLSCLLTLFRGTGIFGPVIGALVSLYTINGKDSVKKHLKSFLSLNFGWKVWLAIFLVLGLSNFIIWFVPGLFGTERTPSNVSGVYFFPLFFFFFTIFGGGQEEIGWRGYILPFLEKRYGLLIGSLILGTIWAIWHIPLFFTPGTNQTQMNFLAYLLLLIGLSWFFSWIIEASGSRLLSGLIAHGALNTFFEFFPLLSENANSKQIVFWIYCIFTFFVGALFVIIRTYKKKTVRP